LIDNVATGSHDTGIYIGQSHDVRVTHNFAMGNVSGFELENCRDTRMDHNESTGNTGGLLTFTNIFLDVKQNVHNRVDHNFIHDNNAPNSCLDPSRGVRRAARDGTSRARRGRQPRRSQHRHGQRLLGIAVANFCVGNKSAGGVRAARIEPNSDDDRIVENSASGNGSDPDPSVDPRFASTSPGHDRTGNCWKGNDVGTQFPPSCHPASERSRDRRARLSSRLRLRPQ